MKKLLLPIGILVFQVFLNPNLVPARAQVPANIQHVNGRFGSQTTFQSILKYAAAKRANHRPFPRLPGEFEPQRAVLLSVSDLMAHHHGVLVQIVEKTSKRVPLVILVNDSKQLSSMVKLLGSIGCDLSHVSFYHLELDTIWLRDFGPRIAETPRGTMSMDFFYDGQRPLDDKFPIRWGEETRAEINKVRWTLHGGNLLCNGKGLGIATSRIFEDNRIDFPNPTPGMNVEFERRKIVIDAIKDDCNVNELIILEPVEHEATKHVDMFATFLAPDQVLVAQVDPQRDPRNARILDVNAQLLSRVTVDGRPMRVERIPVPPREGKYWSPYTNVIFANNLVLMPVYKTDPPALIRNAVNVYRKLLPNFHVDTVDLTSMRALEGALHCMSINVPEFATLPKGTLTFDEARQRVQVSGLVIQQDQDLSSEKSVAGQKTERTEPNVRAESRDAQWSQAVGSTVVPRNDHQVAAVQTYRRKFVDRSGQFSVDAYAVSLDSQTVRLLRADSNQEVTVRVEQLCDEDRVWLTRNVQRIQDNGEKVMRFVSMNQR